MKTRFGLIIVIILAGIAVGTVFYLYSFSGQKADIHFVDLTLDTSDSQTFLTDLRHYKKIKFTLTYWLTGGYVSVTCRDFTLNVEIEDVSVGEIKIDDFEIIGWWSNKTETFILDLSDLPSNDLNYIVNKFYDHKEELYVKIEGSAIINAVITSKEVNPSINKYFLLNHTE